MSGKVPELSTRMRQTLVWMAANEPAGVDKPQADRTCAALSRRGLAEYRGTRATPRVLAWHLTQAGRDWIKADQEARDVKHR